MIIDSIKLNIIIDSIAVKLNIISVSKKQLMKHHVCRCPGTFIAGSSAGVMLTVCDLHTACLCNRDYNRMT